MSLISLLIVLLIFGGVLYLVSLAPIDGTIKRIIQVVAILFLIIWVLTKLAPSLGGFAV
jgi:hypothetical protein